jgi:hypothetical protein
MPERAPRRWPLDEVRSMILSERTTLTAFAEIGCPDEAAPPEIADKVARANALLAELNPLLDEIAAVCGVEDET